MSLCLTKYRAVKTYWGVEVHLHATSVLDGGGWSTSHPGRLPIQWAPGALCLGVKWPGREADHSPPSSAGVEK
jgi:hypothetical protein